MLPSSHVVFSDNGTLEDLSALLSDFQESGKALAIVAAQDALYLGSDLPFNHRYFHVPDALKNTQGGTVTAHLWDGQQWRQAVQTHDLTAVAGVPFARSGMIMWIPDRDYAPALEDTTADMGAPLSSVKIYDKYWVKLTFSAAFSFTLKYVGHKFCKDSDLRTYYSDLDRAEVRTAFFGTATPSWDAIHVAAAEEIIRDLRARGIIWSANQILEPDTFRDAGAHRAAAIIYAPGGLSQPDKQEDAEKQYKTAMGKLNFKVDRNADARLDLGESLNVKTVVVRR